MTISKDISSIFASTLDDEAINKILKVAKSKPPVEGYIPHCTHPGDDGEKYVYEPPEWWTSGFFPGSIWTILERYNKIGKSHKEIEDLATKWKNAIEPQKHNTETHDIGFMIMPAFQREYEINNHDPTAANVIATAAESLMTRWNEKAQCFKSWNGMKTKAYNFCNESSDTLVIIDNMMNLDLLYSASLITKDPKYANHATKHAETTLKDHVRDDWSTYHVVVYDTPTGARKIGITAQGYGHESKWSRGQAWALYGFATVYRFTKDTKFLDAAKNLTDKFLAHVPEDGSVYWDFDAPNQNSPADWDVSAAMIACSGMLQICQLESSDIYLESVARILDACQKHARTSETADTILKHSTVNAAPIAMYPCADTGLVYADYYYLEIGNRLLDMKLAKK